MMPHNKQKSKYKKQQRHVPLRKWPLLFIFIFVIALTVVLSRQMQHGTAHYAQVEPTLTAEEEATELTGMVDAEPTTVEPTFACLGACPTNTEEEMPQEEMPQEEMPQEEMPQEEMPQEEMPQEEALPPSDTGSGGEVSDGGSSVCKPKKKLKKAKKKKKKLKKKLKKAKKNGKKKKVKKLKKKIKKINKKIKKLKKKVKNKC